jgi:hypothetical protein
MLFEQQQSFTSPYILRVEIVVVVVLESECSSSRLLYLCHSSSEIPSFGHQQHPTLV